MGQANGKPNGLEAWQTINRAVDEFWEKRRQEEEQRRHARQELQAAINAGEAPITRILNPDSGNLEPVVVTAIPVRLHTDRPG